MSNRRLVRKDYLILIAVASSFLIASSFIAGNGHLDTTYVVYGQSDPANSNITSLLNIQNIPFEKVRVGDIDIAYKILGNGDPILLVSPA
jgi:hypothetical protein